MRKMTQMEMKPPVREEQLRRHIIFMLVLILAVIGLGSSVYLAASHYNILTGQKTVGSFCQVSEVVNCDAVATSPYAEISYVPRAAVGAVLRKPLRPWLTNWPGSFTICGKTGFNTRPWR